MHDTDRMQLELPSDELVALQEQGEASQFRVEEGPSTGDAREVPLGELDEIELATELLEVRSDAELEQFLGGLMSRVGGAVGTFVRSDTGRALGGILKAAAKKALPVVGRGIGQWISPGRGGDIGASAGRLAGRIFGLELEGLSHEDREFEIARHWVRFAAAAARNAALAPDGPPLDAARRATVVAARTYAPGLLRRLAGRSSTLWPRSGRWSRRGRVIVLFG